MEVKIFGSDEDDYADEDENYENNISKELVKSGKNSSNSFRKTTI